MSFASFVYYILMIVNLYFSISTLNEHYRLLDDKVSTSAIASLESPATTTPIPASLALAANSTTTTPAPAPAPAPTAIPTPMPNPIPRRQLTHKEITFVLLAVSFGTYGVLRQDIILIFLASSVQFALQLYLLGSLMLVHGLLWIIMYANDKKAAEPDEWDVPPGARRYYTTNRGPLVRVW